MTILAVKLFLTPLLIAAATLAGRRWGPGVSGWFIGLPLTSGPISIILTSQYGRSFASQAAVGTLGGQASVCIFCLTYSLLALKLNWPASVAGSVIVFLISTFTWNLFSLALLPTFLVLLLIILLVFRSIPRRRSASNAFQTPAWDLPARMILAAFFVVLLTTFASSLGPQLSGLLSPFPVFGLVLAAFTHYQQGAPGAARFLRGVAVGSLGFATFFLIVSAALPVLAVFWTYVLATLAALFVNSLSFKLAQA